MKKRFLSMILCAALTIGSVVPVIADDYSGTPEIVEEIVEEIEEEIDESIENESLYGDNEVEEFESEASVEEASVEEASVEDDEYSVSESDFMEENGDAPEEEGTVIAVDGVEYTIVNDSAVSVHVCDGDEAVVDVPDSITVSKDGVEKTYQVTAVEEKAFFNNNAVVKIVLPETVISIGKSAFEGCSNLKYVGISSYAAIGEDAFKDCPGENNNGLEVYADAKNKDGDIYKIAAVEGSNINLKCWYTLTLDYMDDNREPEVVKQAFDSVRVRDLDLSDASRSGYRFDGWYQDEAYQNKWNLIAQDGVEQSKVPEGVENITLYAKWTPNDYKVKLEFGNCGSSLPDMEQDVTYPDTQYTFDISEVQDPERDYNTFAGWYTKEEGGQKITTTTYTVGEKNTADNQRVILYAHWTPIDYKINLDLNGGYFEEGYVAPTTYTFYDEEDPTIPNPKRKGYSFVTWWQIVDGIEDKTVRYDQLTIVHNKHCDLAYRAEWKVVPYSITYFSNNSDVEGLDINAKSYTVEDEITLQNASLKGYKFLGWEITNIPEFKNIYVTKIPKGTAGDLSIRACFEQEPIKYKITYVLNAGDENVENPNDPVHNSYDVNEEFSLYDLSRSGYIFDGWYSDESLDDMYKVTGIEKGTVGDKTLYAKWTEKQKYTIQFNTYGHGTAPANQTVYDGESITEPNAPTAEGLIFTGWYRDDNFKYEVKFDSYKANENDAISGVITLNAKWRKVVNPAKNWTKVTSTTTAIICDEDVSKDDAIDFLADKLTTKEEDMLFVIYAPDKNGEYRVLLYGWNEKKGAYTQIDGEESGSMDIMQDLLPMLDMDELKGKLGVYVIGTITDPTLRYTVTFNANGHGTAPASIVDIKGGEVISEPANPVASGYDFGGWYKDAACKLKWNFATDKVESSITLYAKWTAKKYTNTLKYDANGGSGAPVNKTVSVTYPNTQSKITVATTKPKRTGYTFKGWYTAKSGGSKVGTTYTLGSNNKTSNQTATIYAQWSIDTYTITYKLNGGKNGKNPDSYKVTTSDITLQKPTRTGYTFKGWYTDSKFTKKITVIKKGSTGNKTVYAKWEANKYTIKYNANGGSGTMKNQSMTYDKASKLTKNSFSRKNYTFLGWSTDKKATKAKYKNQAEVKNLSSKSGDTVTLYAIWKKK